MAKSESESSSSSDSDSSTSSDSESQTGTEKSHDEENMVEAKKVKNHRNENGLKNSNKEVSPAADRKPGAKDKKVSRSKKQQSSSESDSTSSSSSSDSSDGEISTTSSSSSDSDDEQEHNKILKSNKELEPNKEDEKHGAPLKALEKDEEEKSERTIPEISRVELNNTANEDQSKNSVLDKVAEVEATKHAKSPDQEEGELPAKYGADNSEKVRKSLINILIVLNFF